MQPSAAQHSLITILVYRNEMCLTPQLPLATNLWSKLVTTAFDIHPYCPLITCFIECVTQSDEAIADS